MSVDLVPPFLGYMFAWPISYLLHMYVYYLEHNKTYMSF